MRLRLILFVVSLLGLAAAPLYAQQPVSHETIAVGGTAVGMQATTASPVNVGNVTGCLIAVENAPIRYWVDGTAPTPTSGFSLNPGAQLVLPSFTYASQFLAIATTGLQAILQVSCVRGGAISASVDAGVQTPNSRNPFAPLQVIGGVDAAGTNRQAAVLPGGALVVSVSGGLPLPPCNPVRTTQCSK